jgi:hypothetical protein
MKKIFSLLLLLFFYVNVFSQEIVQEKMPVFEACEHVSSENQRMCFENQVYTVFYKNFAAPENLKNNNYQGTINILFEVDTTGTFKKLYIAAKHDELIKETERVFAIFPKIKAGTYNGKSTYVKYGMNVGFPLLTPFDYQNDRVKEEQQKLTKVSSFVTEINPEFDAVALNYKEFSNPQFKSQLNIPFSHQVYTQFDKNLNQVGNNNHTATKPYSYAEVAKYYNFDENLKNLQIQKEGWWGRKLFNENMVAIQSQDYWFTLNPIVDLRLGKSTPSSKNYTYTNTRALQIQGGLGSQLSFTTTIFETQARFADYYNRYAQSIKPDGGNPAIIPGIGIAKDFQTTDFDLPSADANLIFTPSKFLNLQLGCSRNFIGDGYRSLLVSDGASPYPFFKINTTFWKIKYTNTYMWLKDVRTPVTVDRTYATKYMANHYLSWNVNNRLNIGFFESVVWTNTNNRGFDVNFANPIIFYRSVEFSSSARSGNAVLGLTSKYKFNNNINFYGQFLIDEFSVGEIKSGNKSWRNKLGYQIGAKYYNAFGVSNLYLQAEYNHVRPYVYSHSEAVTNYGHNNQSIGHIWGANFNELTAIARYNKNRWFADAKMSVGVRGFDFDTTANTLNYGSNIYKDYDIDRAKDVGVTIGQGNKANILIADLQAGYLVNPNTNLKLFGSLIYRSFSPKENTATIFKENTTWFSIGLRSDIFNWYFDY